MGMIAWNGDRPVMDRWYGRGEGVHVQLHRRYEGWRIVMWGELVPAGRNYPPDRWETAEEAQAEAERLVVELAESTA